MLPFRKEHFTVLTYDRRGRGQSGGTPPFSIYKKIKGQPLCRTPDNLTNYGKFFLRS